MPSPFDAIVFGPFSAEYHRNLVDDRFKQTLATFLASHLLPQVDHEILSISGTLTARGNEDRYCGPNSAVRNCFYLACVFRGPEGDSEIEDQLWYKPETQQFEAAFGKQLYLWTPTRRRKREAARKAVEETVRQILNGDASNPQCPICDSALKVTNDQYLFDVSCSSGCFNYNFHRDKEGKPLHGHFFMGQLETFE